MGDIADNYFILFKKPSSEDDDEEEDAVVIDDDVDDSDSYNVGNISGEPQFQSTSTAKTTSTELSSSTSQPTTKTVEGHFDSVSKENAFAETTENNILGTRKERDEEEKEFSSRKGYYHFTGNRLPSSAPSSSTTTSTSSNYTKVGVTNQDDMGESLYLSILFGSLLFHVLGVGDGWTYLRCLQSVVNCIHKNNEIGKPHHCLSFYPNILLDTFSFFMGFGFSRRG